jgi:2'-5' RNA ligase
VDQILSAVVVAVPEAEPLVGRLRAELDPAAKVGVPAHVTVLFPFVPPPRLDDEVTSALGEIVGGVPAFTATFAEVRWFGENVVWLAPEPAEPFVALTTAVQERFGLAPYGGEHEPCPHLTVGNDAPLARLRAAAAQVAAGLPVEASIESVRLMAGGKEPNSWTTVAEFPLARR